VQLALLFEVMRSENILFPAKIAVKFSRPHQR